RSPTLFPTRRSSDLGFELGKTGLEDVRCTENVPLCGARTRLECGLDEHRGTVDVRYLVGVMKRAPAPGLGNHVAHQRRPLRNGLDRKSTRLNSSHVK